VVSELSEILDGRVVKIAERRRRYEALFFFLLLYGICPGWIFSLLLVQF
jgi:hypothetical protein